MAWYDPIIVVAKGLKELVGWLFGESGLTKEELEQALEEAVNEIGRQTYMTVATLLEDSEYQAARNQVHSLARKLEEYTINPEEWRLQLGLDAAADTWDSCKSGLDLIDQDLIRGRGLKGHALFLTAAGLRFLWLQEYERFHTDSGSAEKAEESRRILRDALRDGIEVARAMEAEWVDWTGLRFGPLVRVVEEPTTAEIIASGLVSQPLEYTFKWIYRFKGEECEAYKMYWRRGDDLSKITNGALAALTIWQSRREEECRKVREAFVEPSKQVRDEWANMLFLLAERKGEAAEAYASFERAWDAAGQVHTLLAESLRKTHPKAWAEHGPPEPTAKQSLITMHKSAERSKRRITTA